jgi:hypothetical protein
MRKNKGKEIKGNNGDRRERGWRGQVEVLPSCCMTAMHLLMTPLAGTCTT